MAELTVRRTQAQDLDAVMDFYTKMIDEMAGTDFDILWKHDVHPSHAFIRESVNNGRCIIGLTEEDEIVSALIIDGEAAPGYEKVPWVVAGPDDAVGVMHSVATRPAHHGKGYATRMMERAVELSREAGLKSIRLDTFVDNVRSHGLYAKCGFINHGPFPIHYDDLGTIELDMFEYVIG